MKRTITVILAVILLVLALPLVGLAEGETESADDEISRILRGIAFCRPTELAAVFASDPAAAYWGLAEKGISLQPVFRYFEEQGGLTKPKASKGNLTFTVAKDSVEQWGGQKTVTVPVTGLDGKAMTAPAASLLPLIQALEDQWSAPQGLAATFAENPQQAYWDLAGSGVSLAPVARLLEWRGLTKPKAGKEGVTFTVAKGWEGHWNRQKTVKAAVAWIDAKAMTVDPASLPALVEALAAQWKPTAPPRH